MPATARSRSPGRSRVATTALTVGKALSGTSPPGQDEAGGLGPGGAQPVHEPGEFDVAGPVAGDYQHGDPGLCRAHAALVDVGRRRVDHDHAVLRLVVERAQPNDTPTDQDDQ